MAPRIFALILGILLFLAAVFGITGLARRAGCCLPVSSQAAPLSDQVCRRQAEAGISAEGEKKPLEGKEYPRAGRI
ncbi:MAG: hypothetical protein HPY58_03825 [Firmicutes bacterium]|nr:hypothetical protein [Bacillota bacterium]